MESEVREKHLKVCPPELFEGVPDMRTKAGRLERDRRIGSYVTARELLLGHSTDEAILTIATDVNNKDNIYRKIIRIYEGSLPKKILNENENPPGLVPGDIEITAADLGVLDDIDLRTSRKKVYRY